MAFEIQHLVDPVEVAKLIWLDMVGVGHSPVKDHQSAGVHLRERNSQNSLPSLLYTFSRIAPLGLKITVLMNSAYPSSRFRAAVFIPCCRASWITSEVMAIGNRSRPVGRWR